MTRTIPLEHLFELADVKRVPVAYESLLTINALGIQGNVLSMLELDAEDIGEFIEVLKQRAEAEVKKKVDLIMANPQPIIDKLLWDFPRDRRQVGPNCDRVLKRRIVQSPLPERLALEKLLSDYQLNR